MKTASRAREILSKITRITLDRAELEETALASISFADLTPADINFLTTSLIEDTSLSKPGKLSILGRLFEEKSNHFASEGFILALYSAIRQKDSAILGAVLTEIEKAKDGSATLNIEGLHELCSRIISDIITITDADLSSRIVNLFNREQKAQLASNPSVFITTGEMENPLFLARALNLLPDAESRARIGKSDGFFAFRQAVIQGNEATASLFFHAMDEKSQQSNRALFDEVMKESEPSPGTAATAPAAGALTHEGRNRSAITNQQ